MVTDAILNRLAADGVRIRMFTLEGTAIVPCAVWADDDLVVSRIRADFAGVDSVTIVTRQASGEEIGRLSDVAVRPGQREILNAFSAAHLRALPATRVQVTVTAQVGERRTDARRVHARARRLVRSAGGRALKGMRSLVFTGEGWPQEAAE